MIILLLALSIGGAASLASALSGAGPQGWPPDARLVRYPEEIQLPQDHATQEALRKGHAGVREFVRQQAGWKATVDPFAGGLDRAFGDGLEMEDADGHAFLARHRDLFAPRLHENGSSLVLNEAASQPLADSTARFLQYDLIQDGLPVLGAGLSLGVRDERVVLIATRALAPVSISSNPRLDPDQALASVNRYLGTGSPALVLQREPALAFYPRLQARGAAPVLRHHLVWALEVKPEETPFHEVHIAYVDAHDGRVLTFFPEAQTLGACSADPSRAHATVLGGVRPNRADDPERIVHFPFASVDVNGSLVTADLNGRFPYAGGPASCSLRGGFFKIHCDNCSLPVQPSVTATGAGDIDFGTGGASSSPPPVFGNGTSTPADRSAFYHLQQTRLLLQKWDSVGFDEIDAFVNFDDPVNPSCNAFSSAHMLGFLPAGGGCRNTGEIRDVVSHELGHTWDRFDGNRINSGSLSEWKGDLMALALGGDSCVGESFRISGGPSSACSGVRDIDEKAPGRTDHPLTPSVCPTCATLTRTVNNCGGGIHCTGEIAGQATVHLLKNLMNGADYISGVALPPGNPALSAEQARWLLERLLIASGPSMQVLNPLSAGVSIYDAMMLIDDNDANLANGTPHAAYINAAFGHHEIAESPLIADSADCDPLADPIATATVDRDPATGLPLVRIEWTPVGGATTFDVYRNTRAGDSFLPLARNVTGGPILDAGVQVGATYRYFVAAVRKTGCAAISPGGNVMTRSITLPELKVATAAFAEAAGASDGDGLIEPGERISVNVTLRETGGSSPATGVTATLTSASSRSPITFGGSVGFGTVPAGGSEASSTSFEIFIGPAEPCGGRVHLILSAAGNEGCWLDGLDIPLAQASCAVTPSAFVEVIPGSAQVESSPGDGDSDGIADNCETTTISYQIRNTGAMASGTVTSTASTSHPGVTFSPAPSCSLANLNPGASAICQFRFSLGGAAPAEGVPFTLTADSAGNPAPSNLAVRIGSEANQPIFSTQSFGFEGSLQGWIGRQFSLSAARSFSGSQSAHSGSTTINNICGRLTSPAFLLHPSNVSTLTFRLFADIEPLTDVWYDRANVHMVDLDTGQHTILAPSSGVAYNASGNPQVGLCHTADEIGWGGNLGGFSLVTFDLSPFAGRRVHVEINYGSDEGDDREGIYIDDVTLTNVAGASLPPDQQPDACVVPEVSAPAAPVPLTVAEAATDTLRFTWEDVGPGFQYNLYAGTLGSFYSHSGAPLICSGLGAGVVCDGTTCTRDQPGSALPPGNLYFLVTGTGFGMEGTAGFASTGAERDPAQNSCAP